LLSQQRAVSVSVGNDTSPVVQTWRAVHTAWAVCGQGDEKTHYSLQIITQWEIEILATL
jgi:hypothetical protein